LTGRRGFLESAIPERDDVAIPVVETVMESVAGFGCDR
jgi:hypothetical protein